MLSIPLWSCLFGPFALPWSAADGEHVAKPLHVRRVLCLCADQPAYDRAGCGQHPAVRGHLHAPQAAQHLQHLGGRSRGRHPTADGLGSSSRRAGAWRVGAGSSALLVAGEAGRQYE
jgi:hypothetical protein